MKRSWIQFLGAAFVVILATSASAADDAQATFDRLFGASLKAAVASRDTKDDAELAHTLLESGGSVQDNPGLVELCYNNAYALGLKDPSGHATAIEAAIKLSENTSPDKRRDGQEKLMAVYQQRYLRAPADGKPDAAQEWIARSVTVADYRAATGDYDDALRIYRLVLPISTQHVPAARDAIQNSIKVATQRARVAKLAKPLEDKVQTNSADYASHKLLGVMLVNDLDDPAKAAPHLMASGDEALTALGGVLLKPAEVLTDTDQLKLARYYRETARTADPGSKAALQRRAVDAFKKFVEAHEAKDTSRLEATTAIKEIEKDLEKNPPAAFTLAEASQPPKFDAAAAAGSNVPALTPVKDTAGPAKAVGKSNLPNGVTVTVFSESRTGGPYMPYDDMRVVVRFESARLREQLNAWPKLSEQSRLNGTAYPPDSFNFMKRNELWSNDVVSFTYSMNGAWLVPPKVGKYNIDLVFELRNNGSTFWYCSQQVEIAVPAEEKEAHKAFLDAGGDRFMLDRYGMRRTTDNANTPTPPYAKIRAFMQKYPSSEFTKAVARRAEKAADAELNTYDDPGAPRFVDADRKEIARIIVADSGLPFLGRLRDRISNAESNMRYNGNDENYKNRYRRSVMITQAWVKLVEEVMAENNTAPTTVTPSRSDNTTPAPAPAPSPAPAPTPAPTFTPTVAQPRGKNTLPKGVTTFVIGASQQDGPFLPFEPLTVGLRFEPRTLASDYKAATINLSNLSRINGSPYSENAFSGMDPNGSSNNEVIFRNFKLARPWLTPPKPGKYNIELVFQGVAGTWNSPIAVEIVVPPEERDAFKAVTDMGVDRFFIEEDGMREAHDVGPAPPYSRVKVFCERFAASAFCKMVADKANRAAEIDIRAMSDQNGRRYWDVDRKGVAEVIAATDPAAFINRRQQRIATEEGFARSTSSENNRARYRRAIEVNQAWIKLVEEAKPKTTNSPSNNKGASVSPAPEATAVAQREPIPAALATTRDQPSPPVKPAPTPEPERAASVASAAPTPPAPVIIASATPGPPPTVVASATPMPPKPTVTRSAPPAIEPLPDQGSVFFYTDTQRGGPFLPYEIFNLAVRFDSTASNFNPQSCWLDERTRVNGELVVAERVISGRSHDSSNGFSTSVFFSQVPWLIPPRPGKYTVDLVFSYNKLTLWSKKVDIELAVPESEAEAYKAFVASGVGEFMLNRDGMRRLENAEVPAPPYAAVHTFMERFPKSRFSALLYGRAAGAAQRDIDFSGSETGVHHMDTDRQQVARIIAERDAAGFILQRRRAIESIERLRNHDSFQSETRQLNLTRLASANTVWLEWVEKAQKPSSATSLQASATIPTVVTPPPPSPKPVSAATTPPAAPTPAPAAAPQVAVVPNQPPADLVMQPGDLPQGATFSIFNEKRDTGPFFPYENLSISLGMLPDSSGNDYRRVQLSHKSRINRVFYPYDRLQQIRYSMGRRGNQTSLEIHDYYGSKLRIVPDLPGKYALDLVIDLGTSQFATPTTLVQVSVPAAEQAAYQAFVADSLGDFLRHPRGMRLMTESDTPRPAYEKVQAFTAKFPESRLTAMLLERARDAAVEEMSNIHTGKWEVMQADRVEIARLIVAGDPTSFTGSLRERIQEAERSMPEADNPNADAQRERQRQQRWKDINSEWLKLIEAAKAGSH